MAKRHVCVVSCGRQFDSEVSLSRHRKACQIYKEYTTQRKRDRREAGLDEGVKERERQLVEEERRRRRHREVMVNNMMREDTLPGPSRQRGTQRYSLETIPEDVSRGSRPELQPEATDSGMNSPTAHIPSESNFDTTMITPPSPDHPIHDTEPGPMPVPVPVLGRGHRAKRATQKVIDMRPEGPRPLISLDAAQLDGLGESMAEPEVTASEDPPADQRSAVRRVILRLSERFKTTKNSFQTWREYRNRPTNIPDLRQTAEKTFEPTAKRAASKPSRIVKDIIHPFPNISSWRLRRHFWLVSNQNSQAAMDKFLNEVAKAPDFDMNEAKDVNYKKIDEHLANASLPWEDPSHGWRKASVTINVPTGEKVPRTARRRRANHEDEDDEDDIPDIVSAAGRKFDVPGIHFRPILQVLQSTFAADKDMHYDPFDEYVETSQRTQDGSPVTEQVFTEIYNSTRFRVEHAKLQRTPAEPGCTAPRCVAAILLYSDSTQIAEFGNSKLWPIYMFFGNQSKYVRLKPQARAAHHMAYMPSLPDEIRDFIRNMRAGKAVSETLLTHCRRELFHAVLLLLNDEELRHAYEHGILVVCGDGITRRLYPRFFVYSADYPEKVLLCNIRDKGMCPCPRCLVKKEDIHKLGTPADRRTRLTTVRTDNQERRQKIQTARKIIYEQGYTVTSVHVDNLLKSESLVPTENAFSSLSRFGFDFYSIVAVDFLHEIELGIVKGTLVHVLRLLEHFGTDNHDIVNERFRNVGIFGASTIRRFSSNVSELKKLAARDYEDILQCAIPCFEGVLQEPYNSGIIDVLYTILDWHCMAKLRMHTDSTLNILDDLTTKLGEQLRAFKSLTDELDLKETKKEYIARRKREVSRAARQGLDEPPETSRKGRKFNINTPKMHAPGDYVNQIRTFGPIDNHSTQAGEHEHRRSKARYKRVSKRDFTTQLVKLDVREAQLLRMDEELREAGIYVPCTKAKAPTFADEGSFDPTFHHRIAMNQSSAIYLQTWVSEHENDPAIKDFVVDLHRYLLARVRKDERALEDLDYTGEDLNEISIENNKIYSHQTLRINYTTYDVRRDQDVINPSGDKRFIMVRSQADDSEFETAEDAAFGLFWFAEVLGIYHANVFNRSARTSERFDFLWVRWLGTEPENNPGSKARRLMKVGYVPNEENQIPFGFLNPAHVIRGCHLIPVFSAGRTRELLQYSFVQQKQGDWVNFYVNEFVDRDMRMRFLQLGVGHVGYQRTCTSNLVDYGFMEDLEYDDLPQPQPTQNERALEQDVTLERDDERDNEIGEELEEGSESELEDDEEDDLVDEDEVDNLYED